MKQSSEKPVSVRSRQITHNKSLKANQTEISLNKDLSNSKISIEDQDFQPHQKKLNQPNLTFIALQLNDKKFEGLDKYKKLPTNLKKLKS